MIDTYTMILWAKANENKINVQKKQVFDILSVLNKVPGLEPKYITAYKKRDTTEFELTLDNVEKLILKKKDKQFADLGSRMSFFTSLNDDEAVGISINIGVSNAKFQNTIVIDLNSDYKNQKLENFEELSEVFKKLVAIFNPFYGCIASKSNRNMFDTYYNKISNFPTSIFDVNFWGEQLVNNLPISKIQGKVYECVKINKGYYIRLQRNPIDISNESHIKFQKDMNNILGI